MEKQYQVCTKCVMDTTDLDIEFDENGVCSNCKNYDKLAAAGVLSGAEGLQRLHKIVAQVMRVGEDCAYDCVIGLSGGVDSTYTAYWVNKLGLRPLAVHLDNGWNTEIAAQNIKNTAKILDLDLYTYTIDWNEFRDLQLAYLRASVPDIEVPTDHAIVALLYKVAKERGIKYIITGANVVTEGVNPKRWLHYKNDLANLKDIHRQFGSIKLKTFPTLGFPKQLYYQTIKGIKSVAILNYVSYVKKDAKEIIKQELDWQDYGGKHYESIFTRFYQGYILPGKFGIDKRKSHLSSLICSGQITREEAQQEMCYSQVWDSPRIQNMVCVLEKLELTCEEFERIMGLPVKSHFDYKSDIKCLSFLRFIYRMFN